MDQAPTYMDCVGMTGWNIAAICRSVPGADAHGNRVFALPLDSIHQVVSLTHQSIHIVGWRQKGCYTQVKRHRPAMLLHRCQQPFTQADTGSLGSTDLHRRQQHRNLITPDPGGGVAGVDLLLERHTDYP